MRRLLAAWLVAPVLAAQTALPPPLREVGIDQRLNARLPLELTFRDESGAAVALKTYFNRRPVILSLVYYECPMLCTMVLNGLLKTLRTINLDVGRDFEVLTVSFDPNETHELAAAKKQSYIERYGRPTGAAGWHFLTGDAEAIRQLTQAVGFRYKYDPAANQFAHASAIMVLTPDGRLARYLYGIEYPPRDLRLALVEASAGKIGTPVDQVLLYCFHYDPATGKYSLLVMNVLRAAGIATVLALGVFLLAMFRRDRRKKFEPV
ncbi:MAG: SCO family protein [Bryobacterales bacterium]|nr:SCO family protein [Bryobacteraceae bacterium]MDW8353413.1 SCO family protein [Bryobacterales bacterium]